MENLLRFIAVTMTGGTTHQENDFGMLLEPKLRKILSKLQPMVISIE